MLKIILKNVASFGGDPVSLETERKNNLVYGLNGTGKTTLSDFLYFREKNPKFRDCTLDGVEDKKILVYNQNFIRENFHENEELKGIFTLSKENKEAEKEINRIRNEKGKKEDEKGIRQTEKKSFENQKREKLDEIKNAIWRIKTTYTGGDRVLAFCLEGLQRKDKLFDHVIQKPAEKPSQTIDDLKKDAQSIVGENVQEYESLLPVNLNVENIEKNEIFSEAIVGNEEIPVASLITKLNNSDWVKQGIAYLPPNVEDVEKCPFCQQKTITKQMMENIRLYFDETYEKKVEEIKQLKVTYESEKASFMTTQGHKNHPLMQDSKEKFENLYNVLHNSLQSNYSKIERKLNEPSQKITLDDTADKLKKINDLIADINRSIRAHNERIGNKKQTQEEIKNRFWQIMRWEHDGKLCRYRSENEAIIRKIKDAENDIKLINTQIKVYENEIRGQQQNMVNIEEAIQSINKGLYELDIDGFSIQKHQGNSYRVVREGQHGAQFHSLSEGEKMIISFLYFMEMCKGKESKEEIEREKIVVIDDPISSLSHTYVFNLSQWIKKHFFDEDYQHVVVLTHSLYFFRQLMGYSQNKGLFRLTKSSVTKSQIHEMQQGEIKSEYESYWQVIKDHCHNKESNVLLANSMRNILEHFFGFVSKAKMPKILDGLGENGEFAPFLAYMNRESHSYSISITDYKEINPDLFKRAFKNVFINSNYKEHYDKMMGEEKD